MRPGLRQPPSSPGSAPHWVPGPGLTPRPGHAASHPSHAEPCDPESDQAACQTSQTSVPLSVHPSIHPLPCTRHHSPRWGRSQDVCVVGDVSGVVSERLSRGTGLGTAAIGARAPLPSPLRAAPGAVRAPAAWASWEPLSVRPCPLHGTELGTEARRGPSRLVWRDRSVSAPWSGARAVTGLPWAQGRPMQEGNARVGSCDHRPAALAWPRPRGPVLTRTGVFGRRPL